MADVNQLLMDEGLVRPDAAPPRDLGRIKRNVSKMIDGGAPSEDVDAYMASEGFKSPDEWKAAINPAPVSDGMAKHFGQGLSLGTGDEAAAAVRSALPSFSNWMMKPSAFEESLGRTGQKVSEAPTYDQRYEEELAKERQALKDFEAQNPKLAMGSEIAGNVVGGIGMSALPGVGALFRGSAGLGANVAKGVGGGALLGGAQGFGSGEGGFDNRMTGATTGATIGAVAGGTIPVVAKGASIAYEKLAPWALNKVADVAEGYVKKGTPRSLSAAAPEGGQVTQDGLAATIADTSRRWAGNVEEDAAIKRLALELSRSGGVGKARAALDDMGEGAFLAGTSKGATRLANVGNMLPGEAADKYAAAYTARNAETGKRFLGAMGDHADAPGVSRFDKFFEGYRSGKGAEIYDPVLRRGELNVSDEMSRLMKEKSSLREAMERLESTNASESLRLTEAEKAHLIKQELNSLMDAGVDKSGNPVNKTVLRSAARQWEEALWKANPAIQEADTAYAKIASLPEWRDRGLNFMKKGYGEPAVASSAEALADELPRATAQQATAASVGTSNVMADAAKGGAKSTRRLADALIENSTLKEKLGTIYKDDPAMVARILKQSATELKFAKEAQDVLGGSHTGQRLASLSDELGLSITPSASPASIFQMLATGYQKMRLPSEAARSRLADLLANPSREMNAETLSLVEALLQQQARAPRLSPGIAGAAGGSFSSSP